jgi:coenzyme F420-reducing hydrogenase alpha subunit
VTPEGEIRVGILWNGRDVRGVEIASTRPHLAGRVLAGQHWRRATETVPLLFSICRRSQGIASILACEAAQGIEPTADEILAHARVVAAEVVEEYSWRALLDWPHALGEPPDISALAGIRRALDSPGDELPAAARALVEQHVFGMPAADWMLAQDLDRFDRWLGQGNTAAARLLAGVRFADASFGASEVALMPCPCRDALIRDVGAVIGRDENFARAPQWEGRPAETGALARLSEEALVSDLLNRFGRSALARFAARLRELAALLTGSITPALGGVALGPGRGLGWVENARGLLVHYVALDGERVETYRIVAPTEWNFHPRGPLARGLEATPAASEADLKHRAVLLVHSLDPCVAANVEVRNA